MRVLIATVTAGGGHVAAAAALEEAWCALRPEDVVERVDLLRFFSPLHKRIHGDGYIKLVEHAPDIWGMVFKKTDDAAVARRLNKWKRILPSASRIRFARFVKKLVPDVVLCTHYAPLEILRQLKEKLPLFCVSVVTDFEAHALWMDSSVDLYCVAAEETKARLVARGAAKRNVIATGIPISAKFLAKIDLRAIRKNLELRDDLPTLLVLGGGFGMGPVAEILTEVDKVEHEFQTIVVAGRNEKLQRELSKRDYKHPTRILGFATNMHELMSAADLIVTKPGGLTSSEALALGKPMFILNPIPGQEAANSDFLLERGAAAKANRIEDLPYRIEQLLGSPKLKEMARAAKALGKPNAAREICEVVVERMKGMNAEQSEKILG
jgi:processive 1,2-diacylglycerol beta-glucosyltransferase